MNSFISVNQFSNEKQINSFFSDVISVSRLSFSIKNKIMATLFYEPSTRTRFSFEAAMYKLGGQVISESNFNNLSIAKGETLEDTIKTVGNYADVIVLRHAEKGASKRAIEVSQVPIINAGDGDNEHPTQALIDLFTIQERFKNINGLKILFCGDLRHSRTINSLIHLLSLYNVEIITTSPPKYILSYDGIGNISLKNNWHENLKSALKEKPDVIYMTRMQKERHEQHSFFEMDWNDYCLTTNLMKYVKKDAIIMHPLPRNEEISNNIDNDTRAVYFNNQIKNGLKIRMGLLYCLFNDKISWNS